MIEIVLILLFSTSVFFIYKTYSLIKENNTLYDIVNNIENILNEDQDTVQQQFLKFISDSREWAFDYIENVQSEIQKIMDYLTPVVINRDNREYNERDMLESVYKDLKKLLPEQDN